MSFWVSCCWKARFCLVNTFFWSPQQFAGRDVSHAWFGLSQWSTRQFIARKRLLRPSHGALSATESALRLRAQRYNKVCTPDACAVLCHAVVSTAASQSAFESRLCRFSNNRAIRIEQAVHLSSCSFCKRARVPPMSRQTHRARSLV